MRDKFLSVAATIVGALMVAGIVAAVVIPSLLRARVAGGRTPVDFAAIPDASPGAPSAMNTESYAWIEDNAFRSVAHAPLSTFSIDVDTASYANVRRFLASGQLPPPDAVRIEELINYFRFDYPPPAGDAPFSVTTGVAGCPWKPAHKLLHIGLQARRLEEGAVP